MTPSRATTADALLLSDATVPVNFALAGASDHLRSHLGDRVQPGDISVRVAEILVVRNGPHARVHDLEDEGEIATVLHAEHARAEEGIDYQVLTDDGFGKRYADERDLTWTNTPMLVVEMVCAGSLSFAHGRKVWQESCGRKAWPGYEPAISKACPSKVSEQADRPGPVTAARRA